MGRASAGRGGAVIWIGLVGVLAVVFLVRAVRAIRRVRRGDAV